MTGWKSTRGRARAGAALVALAASAGLVLPSSAPPPASASSAQLGGVATLAGGTGHGAATEVGVVATSVAIRDGLVLVAGDAVVRAVDPRTGAQHVVAGTAARGRTEDPGPALAAMFDSIAAVAVAPDGALLIADAANAVVRRVADGVVTTVVGTGEQGGRGDGRPAALAQLHFPEALAFAPDGSLHIADSGTHTIRRVGPDGTITRVAGTGAEGFSGDGGAADAARLRSPQSLAFDRAGNLFVADTGNHRVRRISRDGVITTVAGTGEEGFSGDGGPATAAALDSPAGVLVAPDGTLLIADTFNNRIRQVTGDGHIRTIAGNDGAGLYYDGGTVQYATLWRPRHLAIGDDGALYLADQRNNRVRRVADGRVTTLAGNGSTGFSGDGGRADAAQLDGPFSVAVASDGALVVADSQNGRVRRIAKDGTIRTIAGSGDWFAEDDGDGGPATQARLRLPFGVGAGPDGSVYVSEHGSSTVRRIHPDGKISTVVGDGTAGDRGDGGPAELAQLRQPHGIAVDRHGAVYIADTFNSKVRKVSPNGIITTVAGTGREGFRGDGGPATAADLHHPVDVAVDASGVLYIADSSNGRVRRVADGRITTVAGSAAHGLPACNGDGGPATEVSLVPDGVAVDAAGNLYIAGRPGIIYRVDPRGTLRVVAGDGTPGHLGDDGLAAVARVNWPRGMAVRSVDGRSELLLADWGSNRIRRLAPELSVPCVLRLAGGDRFATAVEVSRSSFASGTAGAVVIARGDEFPDALAAVPLAARLQGPLLLTPSTALHPTTEAEIRRVLRPGGTIHVVGGRVAVAPEVEQRLRSLGHPVERHAGANRFETATAIARALGTPEVILLTTGQDFPDAVSAGAAAASRNGVVVLTVDGAVPEPTVRYLREHHRVPRYAVGGPAVRAVPDAAPLHGADRFATAVEVARHFFPDADVVGITSGGAYPDALSGGPQLGRIGAPLLLSAPGELPAATREHLAGRRVDQARIVGGRAVLQEATAEELSRLLLGR